MKIVQPYARLISPRKDALPFIEWCARVSHRTEEAQTSISWKRFLEAVVISHGDWSVVEHVSASVDILVDRGITHEIVRHRLASYTQESTRFVNYEKKMPPSFIYPQVNVECQQCLNNVPIFHESEAGEYHISPDKAWYHMDEGKHLGDCPYEGRWLTNIYDSEKGYKTLLAKGWRPQEARSVFPNALASRIIVTSTLRNWRHFLIMRTCAEAHPQMRQVTIPLLAEFVSVFPILFDDIVPNQKQSEAIKKAR